MTSSLAAIPGHEKSMADLIVDYLHQIDVEYVFGVPGNAMEPLYDALARSERNGGPRAVLSRHETGAAFMAEGYTRETGKLGVCCTTVGPGATNIITGVTSAYEERVPMLVITGQTPLPTLGLGALQDSSCAGVNIISMFQQCTRYSTSVSHQEQLEGKLIKAITTAYGPTQGPVHLSIPREIGWSVNKSSGSLCDLRSLIRNRVTHELSDRDIEAVFDELSGSRNSIILIGKRSAVAIDAIFEFARITKIPVITTLQGRGVAKSYHPQFRGMIGMGGHSDARLLLESSSLERIIAVGVNFNEFDTCGWSDRILSDKLIHIDSVTDYFSRSFMSRLQICGDLSEIFNKLIRLVESDNGFIELESEVNKPFNIVSFDRRSGRQRRDNKRNGRVLQLIPFAEEEDKRSGKDRRCSTDVNEWFAKRYFGVEDEEGYVNGSASSRIKPQFLMYELSRLFPENTRFLADAGNSFVWANHYLHPYYPPYDDSRSCGNEVIRTGLAFASMGWAIGAAIGTAMGNPANPVVCIVGDGSFLMSGQELSVAVYEKVNVIFFVLNDSELGMIKHGQIIADIEETSYKLPSISYCQMAKAVGAQAFEVFSAEDLTSLDFQAMCNYPGPTLIDVHIDPNELAPGR